MMLQSDIIPTGIGPGWTINCEDTVALGDEPLRDELRTRHPELWSRIERRRGHMRDALGLELRDEVLPLSCTCAYLTPFWLAQDQAFRWA
jgi:hypothetical protein